jgi:predicted transcriptional regulator YdeE
MVKKTWSDWMHYEIVSISEKTVVGIIKKTTNKNMQAVGDIGAVWQQFLVGVYGNITGRTDSQVIGLYTDYEGDCTLPYHFMACCEVNQTMNVSLPLLTKKIPAGKYAKFTTRGHAQKAVSELWQKIWELPLERAYSCDFEVYHNNSENENEQEIDIYVALR